MNVFSQGLTPWQKAMAMAGVLVGLAIWSGAGHAQPQVGQSAAGNDEPGSVELYFFWSQSCPHCLRARPFVHELASRHGWLTVHDLEVSAHPDDARLYVTMARRLGHQAHSVPAFIFCGEMITGFDDPGGIGAYVEERLQACHRPSSSASASTGTTSAQVPMLGRTDLQTWSLPALAVTLGALDSFNPCAFFVLLFLLSLLVHARSRRRMLLIGGLFVTVSGAVYFLFMAAWLNVFLLVGQLTWITLAAGLLAMLMGLLNIKDGFTSATGPSLSIPSSARGNLFARMRGLVSAERPLPLVVGTLALAVAANTYELLCTAGFPMLFTRALTLHELAPAAYYGYLALYVGVYVLPMLVIVALFTATLGRRKLTAREGHALKLMSGLMMFLLGAVLAAAPELLSNAASSIALLAVAVAVTAGLWRRLPKEA